MGKLRMPQHYNDAALLNFLDGETGLVRRSRTRLHLFRCWECRARKAELEAQAHRFARAVRNDVFPDQRSVFDARDVFETRRLQFEQSHAEPHGPLPLQRARRVLGTAAVTGVLALATTIGYLEFVHRPAKRTYVQKTVERRSTAAPVEPARSERPETIGIRPAQVALGSKSKAASLKVHPPVPNAAALEIDVHYRLHRIGACTAEPVLISRRAMLPIVVSAVGPPEERKNQIHAALDDLKRMGYVRVEITEVGQAVGSVTGTGDLPPVRSLVAFTQSAFAQQFGAPDEFVRSANVILGEVDTIYAHAWALRKHAALPGRDKSPPDPLFWLRETMERDHAVRLRQALSKLNADLKPALSRTVAQDRVSEGDLFEYGKEAAALIHRLFAPAAGEELTGTEPETARLAVILVAMDRELSRMEAGMSRSLSHPSGDARVKQGK